MLGTVGPVSFRSTIFVRKWTSRMVLLNDDDAILVFAEIFFCLYNSVNLPIGKGYWKREDVMEETVQW